MRILFGIVALFILSGCESLGEVIREKKYSVNIHETKTAKTISKHKFGYSDDHDYVGYFVIGEFGAN